MNRNNMSDRGFQKDDVYRSIQAYFLHHLTMFKNEVVDLFDKNSSEIQNLKCMMTDNNAASNGVENFHYSIAKYCHEFDDGQKEVKMSMQRNEELVGALVTENNNLRKEVRDLSLQVRELSNQLGALKVANDDKYARYENSLQNYLKVSMDSNILLRGLVTDVFKMKYDILRTEKIQLDNGGMAVLGRNLDRGIDHGNRDRGVDHGNLAAGGDFRREKRDMEEIVETVAEILHVEGLANNTIAVNCKATSFIIQFQEKETLDDWLKAAQERRKRQAGITYQQLIALEEDNVVYNKEPFDCSICITRIERGEGVVLRDCLHMFCRECLQQTVQFSEDDAVLCPFRGENNEICDSALQDREIKEIVSQHTYERHLSRVLSLAENKIKNSFHCKTPDCCGWCIVEDEVNFFNCPVCTAENCCQCQAIHAGMNCKAYQENLVILSETDPNARRTLEYLKRMKDEKNAMHCPTCKIIVVKTDGCDWCQCSMCKTEICWATMGPRWGPLGRGDETGGCRCRVGGARCSPTCGNCH